MTLSLLDPPPEDPQPTDTTLPLPAGWPAPPAPAIYHELLGEIVTTIAPHTEADPVAILTQLLVAFGAAAGRGAFFQVEATRHHPNEFMLLVGDSSKARKGSSWDHARRLLAVVDPSIQRRILTGLSSGEGLIWAVRDPPAKTPASATSGCSSSSLSSPASSKHPAGRSRRSRRRCAPPGTAGRWQS